jgi:hypothetical protein
MQSFLLALLSTSLPLCIGCNARIAERPAIRDDRVLLSRLSGPPDGGACVVSFHLDGGLPLIDSVRVNGQLVGPMVIDTGAAWTVLDRGAAERLGITQCLPWTPDVNVNKREWYRVSSLQVGDLALRDHVVPVVDMTRLNHNQREIKLAGVIGGDLWGALPYTINWVDKTLTIHSRVGFKPPAGSFEHRLMVRPLRTRGSFMNANPSAGQPAVKGRIDGIDASFMLDTACVPSLALNPWFVRKHPMFVDPESRAIARVSGAPGAGGLDGALLRRAKVGKVDALGASFQSAGTAVALAARPGDSVHGFDLDAAILGLPYLKQGLLTFDYASGRVWTKWIPREVPQ